MNHSVVFLSAVRTPFGAFQGALSSLPAHQLGARAIDGALKQAQLSHDVVSEVVMGCVLQAGQGQAPARQAALGAGLPQSVPAVTINKVCGSGMKSIMLGAQSILLGDSDVVVAGGMENMSQAPYLLTQARDGFRMGNQTTLDSMVHDGLWDPYNDQHMGNCGELCARENQFSREAQDQFAIESFQKAQKAQNEGLFKNEMISVEVPGRKGPTVVDMDEGPAKVKFEKIPTLRPAFQKDGTVTAANASSLNDGAAAVVLASAEKAKALGKKPLARLISYGTHAQAPEWFTTAPATAMKNAMDKAGWSVSDVDLFEINEAFAVVALAAESDLSIPREKINVHGGAISIGHPIGASGARIVVTLIHALRARNLKKGVAGICIGGGEATAVCVEIED
ncbi:MAG: acetyl-CoA C-acyltransferase [Bdellovibrionaceae bacterium]|nr:acetyl-CoA C-acyltransferase [Pseudobdellovibrionaceae bacterium]|tara:strand:+ start:147 stop:1328 length:1182 start_codon:yes stop_codon:yes gene_type:complete